MILGQSPQQAQTDLFTTLLAHQLNPHTGHVILWKKLAEVFDPSMALHTDKVKKGKKVMVK